MDSLILDTAIGLVFLFATGAALVSVITESISRYIGLRSEYLLRGIRTLLDGSGNFTLPLREAVTGRLTKSRKATLASNAAPAQPDQAAAAPVVATPTAAPLVANAPAAAQPALVARIMSHPLVGVTTQGGGPPLVRAGDAPLTNKQRRTLPSYLSGRSFARALVDLVVPNSADRTTMMQVRDAIQRANLPGALEPALLSLADGTVDDIAAFRTNVEHWYDDEMARVSGWYKRHTRWVSLAIGVVLVIGFNLNVLSVARSIYTDEAVRGSVVTQASQASQCTTGPADCLQQLRANIDTARGAGLPIGWTTVPACDAANSKCTWFERRGLWVEHGNWLNKTAEFALVLLGWMLMTLALLPGANFWFDILGRLGTLRTTGQKPAAS